MPVSAKGDEFLGPEFPHDGNLLFLSSATGVKVLIERFIFGEIPADTDTEAQALAREQIHFGSLLGHQSRLALRKDQNTCRKLDSPCDAGKESEKRKRLVELVVVEVG